MTRTDIRLAKQSSKRSLALLDDAAKALAVCVRVDAAKDIRDKAIAFETYAKQAKDTLLVERATEIRFRAETKAGELLHDMAVQRRREIRGGDRRSKGHRVTLKLADLGITKKQASRWQILAAQKLAFPEIWQQQLQWRCRMAVAVTEGNKAILTAAKV